MQRAESVSQQSWVCGSFQGLHEIEKGLNCQASLKKECSIGSAMHSREMPPKPPAGGFQHFEKGDS